MVFHVFIHAAHNRTVENRTPHRMDEYMKHHKNMTPVTLLSNNQYELFQ